MIRLIAIRPEPGLADTLSAAASAGLEIEGFPLFEVGPVEWDAPVADGFDGLLLGSVNALRWAGDALGGLKGLPVHAVGARTAQAARDVGFRVETQGEGGLQQVVNALAGRRLRLLRLAGRDHVPLELPAGVSMTSRIVYDAKSVPMPARLAARLGGPAAILLHSAAAARHLASECDRLAIDKARLHLLALGPRIAEAAGTGWASSRSCAIPSEAALLALAAHMCH